MKILGDINIASKPEGDVKDQVEVHTDDDKTAQRAPAPQLVEDLAETMTGGQVCSYEEVSAGTEHYAAAVRYYLKGELDEALDQLLQARDAGEDTAEIPTAMAQIYIESRDFEKAAEAYAELVSIDSTNGAARFNLGLALEAVEKFDEAREAFRGALEHEPDLVDAYLGLAGCSIKTKDLKGAAQAYLDYLEYEPGSYTATFGLGVVAQLSDDLNKAAELYNRALEKQPDSEEVYTNLASVYAKSEQYTEAANCYRQILKTNPNSLKALEGLAFYCYREGFHSTARTHYQQLVSAAPDSFEAWYNLGLVNQKLEEREDAVEAYQKALGLQNDSVDALLKLATCQHELQRNDEAKRAYEAVLEIDENSASALQGLVAVIEDTDDLDAAVPYYSRLAQITESPEPIFRLAVALQKNGNWKLGQGGGSLRTVHYAEARLGGCLAQSWRRLLEDGAD